MPDSDDLLDVLRNEIVTLAQSHFDEYREQAIADGESFLEATKDDLTHWTRLMDEGELSQQEFESLVRGKKDLAEMNALKQAGLAAARADQFRDAIVDRVVDTAAQVLL
jgi:hypothetical protein